MVGSQYIGPIGQTSVMDEPEVSVSHLKDHTKLRWIVFLEICAFEFCCRKFSNNIPAFLSEKTSIYRQEYIVYYYKKFPLFEK
jgi:hypothetical protein